MTVLFAGNIIEPNPGRVCTEGNCEGLRRSAEVEAAEVLVLPRFTSRKLVSSTEGLPCALSWEESLVTWLCHKGTSKAETASRPRRTGRHFIFLY